MVHHTRRHGCAMAIVASMSLCGMVRGQATVFVDDDAPAGGDGASWATAYSDLQDALDQAAMPGSPITEVRIAGGIYKPDRGTGDTALRFEPVGGLMIQGGYAGLAGPDPDVRDPVLHETALSMDLMGDDVPGDTMTWDDNSEQLLVMGSQASQIVFDGLTFSGHSILFFPVSISQSDAAFVNCTYRGGSALLLVNSTGDLNGCTLQDSPFLVVWVFGGAAMFNDCEFRNNSTAGLQQGGALRITAGATVNATQCVFADNAVGASGVQDAGGAVYLAEASSLTLDQCQFTGNHSNDGGGAVVGVNGSAISAADCQFIMNSVGPDIGNGVVPFGGGAIACKDSAFSAQACLFEMNDAARGGGGAVRIEHGAAALDANLIDCQFTNNMADSETGSPGDGGFGGAVHALVWRLTLEACDFQGNQAVTRDGGGAWIQLISDLEPIVLTACSFVDNQAGRDGGAIAFDGPSNGQLDIALSTFARNTAAQDGGAMRLDGSQSMTVNGIDLVVLGNTAGRHGGGIQCEHELVLHNALIHANAGVERGGGLYHDRLGGLTLLNCTVSHNTAATGGGIAVNGFLSTFPVTAQAQNTIVWGNRDGGAALEAAQIALLTAFAFAAPDFSIIEGLTGVFGGTGNLGDDPQFIDPDGADDLPGTDDDDLHLQSGSPAIDSGDNAPVMAAGLTSDLDGNVRIGNGIVDMGAYEAAALPRVADINDDGVVNVTDLLMLLAAWGPCPGAPDLCPSDLDSSGAVNVTDLLMLLADWG